MAQTRHTVYEVSYSPSKQKVYAKLVEKDVIDREHPYFTRPAKVLEQYELAIPRATWGRIAQSIRRRYGTGQRAERSAFEHVKRIVTA